MTFSALRKKDVICIGDGRVLGRIADLELDASCGQIRALIVPAGMGAGCCSMEKRASCPFPGSRLPASATTSFWFRCRRAGDIMKRSMMKKEVYV